MGSKRTHSPHGLPGGQRSLTSRELFEKDPILLIESAVKGMLPKNRLGRKIYKNMHVYVGAEHPHEAQKPEVINFNEIKF